MLSHPSFRLAGKDMAGTSLGIGAWGLVTGVAMIKSGMSLPMAVFMSLVVYAGSAQLAVLPLLMVGAPLWVVWLTAACVNLRFVIFSSMWRNYFAHLPLRQRLTLGYFSGDVIFVAFLKRYPEPRPAPDQVPYFWGAASVNWLTIRAAPPMSRTDRFILSAASLKMRSLAILAASWSASRSVSPCMAQTRISRPGPISPVVCPATVTLARLTRWTTALTARSATAGWPRGG